MTFNSKSPCTDRVHELHKEQISTLKITTTHNKNILTVDAYNYIEKPRFTIIDTTLRESINAELIISDDGS